MEESVKEIKVAFTRRIPLVMHTCPVCKKVFEGSRLAVYCSIPCRKSAAWQRNGKKYNANRKKG
jgi:hypothetical protein